MPLKSRHKPASELKKKKPLVAPVKGRQLEAAVHTCLPPLVKGALRGHLVVSLESGIVWEYRVGPPTPKLCVQLKWWGEKSPGTTFRVPVQVGSGSKNQLGESTTLAYYPIRSALSHLSAYLRDMGSLTFQVGLGHMTDNSMVIGQAIVPSLRQLTPNSQLKGRYPVVNGSGVHLGKLCVDIGIKVNPQQREESAQKKVTLGQAEFIVGPGATFREIKHRNTPLKLFKEDTSTLVGEQNKSECSLTTATTTESMVPKETVHIPAADERESGWSVPGEKTELGIHQLEVISELIERGQLLRSKMVRSIVSEGANREESLTDSRTQEREMVDAAALSFLSDGVKRHISGNGGSADLKVCGIDVEISSEEEYDVNDVLSDVSLDASDYPLHNEQLLSALYSLGPPHSTTDGVCPEDEGECLVNVEEQEEKRATTEQSEIDKNPPLVPPPKTEPPKLASKLSKEQQQSTPAMTGATHAPNREGELSEPDMVSNVESVTLTHSQQSKVKTDSLTKLSAYFVKGQSALETEIVSAIGLERLTQLGRVGSARLTVASVQMEPSFARQILTQHRERKKKTVHAIGSNVPLPSHSTKSPTYFVEYQFPAAIQKTAGARHLGKRLQQKSHELMRIASKKMKGGVVKFNHHSVFPLEFSSSVLLHWWHSSLIFRVYCRPPTERMPFLVGKAVLPLKRLLTTKSSSNGHYHLEIKASTLADAVKEGETDDTVVGSLEISLEFGRSGKGDFPLQLVGTDEEEAGSMPGSNDEILHHLNSSVEGLQLGNDAEREKLVADDHNSPIHFRETHIATQEVSEKPPALQLLMLIPEALDVSTISPSTSPSPPVGQEDKLLTPNCYLVCKLFCAKPHPKTPVQWASQNPQFGFKQLVSLYLTPALLSQVANNFTVVEVWHRTPGTNTEDELIGLVKLSLHQFYLAFGEEQSVQLCCQAELPVVAVDAYCPIVNPFSGHIAGHLAVLMALGTPTQIAHLQQVYASGSYTLQLPHRPPRPGGRRRARHRTTSTKPTNGSNNNTTFMPLISSTSDQQDDGGGPVEHVFDLCVEGVRDAAAFASTVWGEADCFVQYHFPTLTTTTADDDDDDDDDANEQELEVCLHPYRTETTLCVPNPAFSHETRHTFLLDGREPVQKYIMSACGGGLGGGVPFELWRRYYYPNIRDQLVARASLPVAKLCSLITMHGTRGSGSYNAQEFALPLKLITDSEDIVAGSGGVLDLSVQYKAMRLSDGKNVEVSHHVNITVGILRAAGLKDAAALVAPDNPIALGLAAEVGVNTYATIALPGILKEKRRTKTIARSFSPEFSHLFDVALPLTFHSVKVRPVSSTTLAERLAEGCMVVELWHQPPKRSGPSTLSSWQAATSGSGVVTGRRLAPGTKDVLLGQARVPLVQLLQKSTGVHGWFVLESPLAASSTLREVKVKGGDGGCGIIGGVEISAAFTKEESREMVITNGLRQGWRVPDHLSLYLGGALHVPPSSQLPSGNITCSTEHAQKEKMTSFNRDRIKFEIGISHVTLPLNAVDIPTAPQPTYKYCFVRYRFFDKKALVTSPKPITWSREGFATYQLNHRAHIHLRGSAQLQWYLSEESVEVQVWVSLTRGQLREEGPRPLAEDVLIGSVYVPLNDVIYKETIRGDFPLFKAGVDRLGGQNLHVEIHRDVVSDEATPQPALDNEDDGYIDILDSSEDEVDFTSQPAEATEEGKKKGREKEEEVCRTKKPSSEEEREKEEIVEDTFSARIVIHEALHLPARRSELGPGGSEVPPSPYVTAHPHPNVERITTATVTGSSGPVWEHQCTTKIPNHYLQPQSQGLEFQVWSKNDSNQDTYIGSVCVDLCPLTCGLGHICGWYNVTDFGGQTKGQLKISISPTQRISYPSPLLAYSTLVTDAGSFHLRDVPLPSSSGVVKRDSGHSELSTEQLLSNSGAAEGRTDQLSSKTKSMLFQQLREEIQQLEGIQKGLLTKLGQRETTGHSGALSSSLLSSSQYHQSLLPQDVIALRCSGTRTIDEAPPSAPPILVNDTSEGGVVSPGSTYSVRSQSPSSPCVSRDQHEIVEAVFSENSSSSTSLHQSDNPTQSELTSTTVRGKSPPPSDEPFLVQSPREDSRDREEAGIGGSQIPLTADSSRSGSLTDVSSCSRDSSSVTPQSESHVEGQGVTLEQRMKPDSLRHSEEDELDDSDSECCLARAGSPHSSKKDELDVKLDKCESQDLEKLPKSTTTSSTTSATSHLTSVTCATTVARQPDLPAGKTTTVSTTPPSLLQTCHDSTSEPQRSSLLADQTKHPPENLKNPPSRRATLPPSVRLPNFFMTPQQLEESMRSLRAGALSRPPPKTHSGATSPPKPAWLQEHHHSHHESLAAHLKTLQEVRAYLEARRTVDRSPQTCEISAAETQRLARIFST